MKQIYLKDIKFKNLKLIHGNYLESEIYHDNNLTYKLYKGDIGTWERTRKRKKMEEFGENKTNLPILVPKAQILFREKNPRFIGYVMDYFEGCNLSNWIEHHDILEILELEKRISLALKKIHEDDRNIILGDLHFGNILINEEKDFRFCDFDSYHIGKRKADSYSYLLEEYLRNKKIPYRDSRKLDNISLLLMTYGIIFNKRIMEITPYEYDEKKEELPFLEQSKRYYKSLRYAERKAPFVPYLHEMMK